MAGTAPDATTTFNLNGVGATDAALLALLGNFFAWGPSTSWRRHRSARVYHGGMTGQVILCSFVIVWRGSRFTALTSANWWLNLAVPSGLSLPVLCFDLKNAGALPLSPLSNKPRDLTQAIRCV